MSFDLNSLDTASKATEGAVMKLSSPKNGSVLEDDKGLPYTITLRGRHSIQAIEVDRRYNDARSANATRLRGMPEITQEDVEEQNVSQLIACTVGWYLPPVDGEVLEFSTANARKLWTDARFRWLREQAFTFIQRDSNFVKG